MHPQLQPTSRRPRWPSWAVAMVLCWLALVGAAEVVSRMRGKEVSLCMFRNLTHLPCPSCGTTRMAISALTGHPVRAWLFNPLFATAGLVAGVVLAIRVIFGRRVVLNLNRVERIVGWSLLAAAMIANWAYVIRYVG